MKNLEKKYKLSCHITVQSGYCHVIGEDGEEHGAYNQQIFKRKSRPDSWTNEEFLNWQYPKKEDPLCGKCRKLNQKIRNDANIKESMEEWLNSMSPEQQIEMKNHLKDQQYLSEQEEHIRRQKGFVTKVDFKAMQLGDHND